MPNFVVAFMKNWHKLVKYKNEKQIFNVQEINIVINKLNLGIDPDDVHIYHLKKSTEEFRFYKFYNLCTYNECIPRRMKNDRGNYNTHCKG